MAHQLYLVAVFIWFQCQFLSVQILSPMPHSIGCCDWWFESMHVNTYFTYWWDPYLQRYISQPISHPVSWSVRQGCLLFRTL